MSALALAIPAMVSLADPAVKGLEPQDVTADDKGEATGNDETPDAKAAKPDDTTTPKNGEKKVVPAKKLFGTKLTAAALAPRYRLLCQGLPCRRRAAPGRWSQLAGDAAIT